MTRARLLTLAIMVPLLGVTGYLLRSPAGPGPLKPADTRTVAAQPMSASAEAPGAQLVQRSALCSSFYRTICAGKQRTTRDPTGVVHPDTTGELEALRTYEEIIREHRDWTSEQVDEELVQRLYTPKRRARLRQAFEWVRGALEEFITRQDRATFTARERRELLARLRRVKLELPPPAALYHDEPDLFTKNDVYYERLLNGEIRLRVGGAFPLTSRSWFNMVFTMAHEFGHAIDPCEVRNAGLAFPAYDRLTACFLSEGLVAARRDRQECGENDQLSEIFADWLAVQITAKALRVFATEFHGPQLVGAATNAVRDLCEQDEVLGELDLTAHPAPEVRIERIFGRNPVVREVLGCGPVADPTQYCGFDAKPPQPVLIEGPTGGGPGEFPRKKL